MGVQEKATIYFGLWLVLFEYSSFDHFPKLLHAGETGLGSGCVGHRGS